MSAVVVSAVKLTFGLFLTKVRVSLSENLKDGDLNSQELRSLITSNMENIKTKIDGLSRCELLSSASFIEEGMLYLNDSLNESRMDSLEPFEGFHRTAAVTRFVSFNDVFDHYVHFKNWLKR